jgi:large subunit ribosomal protein L30e
MTGKEEIKEALKEGRVLLGRDSSVRLLKAGKLKSVFFATNCAPETRKELEYYGKVGKVELKGFKGTSAQLGQLCGKPFNVTILGIKK